MLAPPRPILAFNPHTRVESGYLGKTRVSLSSKTPFFPVSMHTTISFHPPLSLSQNQHQLHLFLAICGGRKNGMGEEMAIEEANVLFSMVFQSKWMLMQWSNTRLAAANTRRLLETLPSRHPYSEGQYALAFNNIDSRSSYPNTIVGPDANRSDNTFPTGGTCTTAYNDGRQTSGHQQDALSAMRMVRNNSYSGLLPEIIVILLRRLILGPLIKRTHSTARGPFSKHGERAASVMDRSIGTDNPHLYLVTSLIGAEDALSAMRMVRNNSYSGLLPEIIVIIASRLLILGPRQIAYGTLQPVVLARNMQDSFLDSFALGLVITNGVGLGSYPIGTEKLEEEFRMEIDIKDSEMELELNKLKDLAKAELIATIASEKAYEIEKNAGGESQCKASCEGYYANLSLYRRSGDED
ncbi:hypothetical protein Tco_0268602 [Tanacetum coccineum]